MFFDDEDDIKDGGTAGETEAPPTEEEKEGEGSGETV